MKIAIPVTNGKLAQHFGHCKTFALVDVDPEKKEITGRNDIPAPPHEPGVLPPFLAERGATMIIAGGMGGRAHQLFADQGIEVVVGAPSEDPDKVVSDYINGKLVTGANTCDH